MRKALAFLLLFMMILPPLAAPRTALSEGEPEPEIVEEVLGLRETNSETFALSDGSYECVVYASDKYYDAGGSVPELIDNSIIEKRFAYGGKEYAYSNAANSTRYYFASDTPSVLAMEKDENLSFELLYNNATTVKIGGSTRNKAISGIPLCGDNYIAYEDVFEDTELVYEARNGVLKEYIVLNSASAPSAFTFDFVANNYSVRKTEKGSVAFISNDGDDVFELASLFAIDSSEVFTEDLTYEIDETIVGVIRVTVSLSDDYLYAPERMFPVVIDPSIVRKGTSYTKDTFVSSLHSSANYYLNNYLRFGWDSNYNIRRSYIKFELPDSVLGKVVTTSYMSLKKYDCGNDPSLKAYRVTGTWTPDTVTWNNKPGITSDFASDPATPKTNNWYRFYVTDIVRRWCNNTYSNYGLMVRNSSESGLGNWSTFYSSDASYDLVPQLRITYLNTTGLRFFEDAPFGNYTNCAGYALSIGDRVEIADLFDSYPNHSFLELDGHSIATALPIIKTALTYYLNSEVGSFSWEFLTDGYEQDIPSNYYRVVFRIGLKESANSSNGVCNYNMGDLFLYHWYYQTCSYGGVWAHKNGVAASQTIANSAGKNPATFNWHCEDYNTDYTSDLIYLAIRTREPQPWYTLAEEYEGNQ